MVPTQRSSDGGFADRGVNDAANIHSEPFTLLRIHSRLVAHSFLAFFVGTRALLAFLLAVNLAAR